MSSAGAGAGEEVLRELDELQRQAVISPPGPQLVVAGPGAGKTRTLVARIAWALRVWGFAPSQILAITFTRKAAEEVRERVRAMFGPQVADAIAVHTFHAAALRLIAQPFARLMDRDPGRLQLYAGRDQQAVLTEAIGRAGGPAAGISPAEASARIAFAKARGHSPATLAVSQPIDDGLAAIWRNYRAICRERHALDFEDLIAAAVHLLRSSEEVRARIHGRFRMVLVDEFQDSSPLQGEMAAQLAGPGQNVTAIGDSDQRLYSWRGADEWAIDGFLGKFPQAVVSTLATNYRSHEEIAAAAHRLIGANPGRRAAQIEAIRGPGGRLTLTLCEDERIEAAAAVGWVRERREIRAGGEISVLCRSHAVRRRIERELSRHGVGYDVLGAAAIFDCEDGRAVLSVLRYCTGREEELGSLLRLARGVGEATVARLSEQAREGSVSLGRLLEGGAWRGSGLQRRAVEGVERIWPEIRRARALAARGSLGELAAHAREVVSRQAGARGDDPYIERANAERLDALVELAAGCEADGHGLGELLLRATLGESGTGAAERAERVQIASVHQAKGLEWPVVCVPGLSEGTLPGYRALVAGEAAIAEERCVAYVAMTRARDELRLSASEKVGDRSAGVSRFCREAGLCE